MEINVLDFINNVSVRNFNYYETIFSEGQDSQGQMYFIFSGELEVFKEVAGDEKSLRVLMPGEFFGEIALISKAPRTASVRVVSEKARVGVLDQEMFYRIGQTNPKFFSMILRAMIDRLYKIEAEISTLYQKLEEKS